MKDGLARLTPEQQELVGKCLDAIVHGPYVEDDDEFEAVMGVTRAQVTETLEARPEEAAHGQSFMAVNNALNNLRGYPHGQWRELSRRLGASERDGRRHPQSLGATR